MPSGESEHPLRADPLHHLPDAVTVPRRPRPRARLVPHSAPAAARGREPLPQTSADARAFEQQARELLRTHDTGDPLLTAIAESARTPPSPPAGNAFATDIQATLAAIDDPRERDPDPPPAAAGVVDRSDVSLFPSAPEKGAASGVYVVRSRRNWALGTGQAPNQSAGHGAGQSPSSEPVYYHVRRSIADFAWLEERLRYRYEGVIVPPLPPMALAGRIRHGYAYDAERRRGLERFLRRVATHPVLSTGDEVLSFLGATEEEAWRKIRREPISHESSITTALFGGGRDSSAMERLGHWSEKVLWQAGRKVNKGLVWFLERDAPTETRRREDSAEARLERLQSYVQELGLSLSTVRHAVRRVSQNREQEMRGVAAMQTALRKLGEREGGSFGSYIDDVTLEIPPEVVTPVLSQVGSPGSPMQDGRVTQFESETSDTNTLLGENLPLPTARAIDDLFQDYEERARGAQRIMNARKEEKDAYEHALAVYTKLRDKLESKTGSMWETSPEGNGLNTRGEEMEELVNDVSAASARLADVRRRYQAVALSTTDELRRLRNDLHSDLGDALQNVATEFSRQHAAHARAWASLAKSLAEYRDASTQ